MVRGRRELVPACSGLGGAGWFGVFWAVFQSSFAFEEENDKKMTQKKIYVVLPRQGVRVGCGELGVSVAFPYT
jgi:hypothetical protein